MNNKIKIMQILRPAEGGMKNHVETLISNLDKEKYDTILVCPGAVAAKMNIDCKFYNLDINDGINPSNDWAAVSTLCKLIAKEKPDLLHTHGTKASLISRLAAKRMKVPGVITTAHNFIYQTPSTWLKGKLLSYLLRGHLIPEADQYISVSKALARNIIKNERIPKEKMNVIYNGIDLKQFEIILDCHEAKAALHLDIKEPVVGVIARLIPQKGVHHFLKMADIISKKLPGCQFLIIGSGPQRDALVDMAHNMGIAARIIFLGFREDINTLLPIINVLVIPSLSEGLSITALEGMAARRPIVAYNTGGLSEIIINEETGLLVKRGDIHALSQGVIELLIHRQKAERLGNTARNIVEKKFSLEKMVLETERVYEKVLLSKGYKDVRNELKTEVAIN